MGRLVILGGPSCAGKGPLVSALNRFHPELAARLSKLVLYNTRAPRPGEKDGVDYHFRTRQAIDRLTAEKGFPAFEVRGDYQALDLDDLRSRLISSDVLFEGNPYVGEALIKLSEREKVPRLALFLSPFSREELTDLSARLSTGLSAFVAEVMRRKQARRKERQRGILTRPDFDEIERRATAAYTEIKMAHLFERVIVCHDGEDSENWDGFYYPIADARRALAAFVSLLKGNKEGDAIENWEGLELP